MEEEKHIIYQEERQSMNYELISKELFFNRYVSNPYFLSAFYIRVSIIMGDLYIIST